MPEPGHQGIDAARVRAHLAAILASPGFAASSRLSNFLRYIVEKSLEGKDGEIKEYSIAVEVYGRPADYDTQNESIVRVEASRLRKRLAEYYEAEGSDAGLRMELPRGTYRPVFHVREGAVSAGCQPGAPAPIAPESVASAPGSSASIAPAPAAPVPDASAPPEPLSTTTAPAGGPRPRWSAVAAVAVVALVAAGIYYSQRTRVPPVESIAVLPLVNLTGSPQEDAFTDGLTEDLTTSLSKLPALRVLARTTMASYKNKAVNLKETGASLGVRSFLEGSVRRDGGDYIITAQLINTSDGYHLWAETYRRPAHDPIRLQEGLSREIAKQIDDRLNGHAAWRSRGRTPPSGAALNLYTEAHSLLQKDVRGVTGKRGIPEHFTRAIGKLKEAVALNPDFAQAWVLLSTTYEICIDLDPAQTSTFLPLAIASARRAVEIDDTVAEAHGMLGALAMYREFDLKRAEAHYRRAVELNPRDASYLRYYSDILRILGRPEQSRTEIDRAILLSPTDNRLFLQKSLLFYSEGQYGEAMKTLDGVLAAQPSNPEARWLKSLLLEKTGRAAEAETELRAILATRPGDVRALPALGHLLGSLGRRKEALEIAARLEQRVTGGFINHYGMAIIFCGMKENEKAIQWLERSAAIRDHNLIYLMVEDRLRPLHADPRVRRIARDYGILNDPAN